MIATQGYPPRVLGTDGTAVPSTPLRRSHRGRTTATDHGQLGAYTTQARLADSWKLQVRLIGVLQIAARSCEGGSTLSAGMPGCTGTVVSCKEGTLFEKGPPG